MVIDEWERVSNRGDLKGMEKLFLFGEEKNKAYGDISIQLYTDFVLGHIRYYDKLTPQKFKCSGEAVKSIIEYLIEDYNYGKLFIATPSPKYLRNLFNRYSPNTPLVHSDLNLSVEGKKWDMFYAILQTDEELKAKREINGN